MAHKPIIVALNNGKFDFQGSHGGGYSAPETVKVIRDEKITVNGHLDRVHQQYFLGNEPNDLTENIFCPV